jgi:hypothetical protein
MSETDKGFLDQAARAADENPLARTERVEGDCWMQIDDAVTILGDMAVTESDEDVRRQARLYRRVAAWALRGAILCEAGVRR